MNKKKSMHHYERKICDTELEILQLNNIYNNGEWDLYILTPGIAWLK